MGRWPCERHQTSIREHHTRAIDATSGGRKNKDNGTDGADGANDTVGAKPPEDDEAS